MDQYKFCQLFVAPQMLIDLAFRMHGTEHLTDCGVSIEIFLLHSTIGDICVQIFLCVYD
jgi:hypothetical protein